MPRFWLYAGDQRVVGPHSLAALQEWVARGAVGSDWQVLRDGDEAWKPLGELLAGHDLPMALQRRIESARQWNSHSQDRPTELQMFKLRYFQIPFAEEGLTRRRASEILECFAQIDPATERAYQDRPATENDMDALRQLGSRPRKPMTHGEARARAEELRRNRYDGSSRR